MNHVETAALSPAQLKAWRAALGFTQQRAAEALGMTRRGYQHLEAGSHRIDRRTALACTALARGLTPYGLESVRD